MKKQLFIAGIILMFLPTIYSCTKGFKELNVDPINITTTSPDKLLAPALVNSLWPGMSRNRSFNNELMQVTVSMSDGDNTTFRYAFRTSMSDYLWNAWYVQLTNFNQVDSLARVAEVPNASYQAIGKIGKVWLFANLTDIYGDIPYSQALEGDQSGAQQNVTPAFDRQKDIYLDMFNQLKEANALLAKGDNIVLSSDPLYNGDISKWKKFANSLRLRLLMRVSGKAEVQQECIDQIREIVQNPSVYPIFENNADCAALRWSGGTSNTDPYTSPYVNGIRAQDFRGPAICSFFLDPLLRWSDPRIVSAAPYGYGSIGRLGISQASGGGWFGVKSGYVAGQGGAKGSYFQSYDNASTGGVMSLQQNERTGIIMQYAEVQFILAEAAAKGWIDGNTKDYLYQGMASAINYWVPNFPESTTSENFEDYLKLLSDGGYIWNDDAPLDVKMEMIHQQKYYALFLTDLQQWFEYRRTGLPDLHLSELPGLSNGGVMPARLVYPVYVQAANPVNYRAAVAAQGPDEINTNVWWQKP